MNLDDKIPDTNVSVLDVIFALCDVMDDSDAFDVQFRTGLSDHECHRIVKIRDAVSGIWSWHLGGTKTTRE